MRSLLWLCMLVSVSLFAVGCSQPAPPSGGGAEPMIEEPATVTDEGPMEEGTIDEAPVEEAVVEEAPAEEAPAEEPAAEEAPAEAPAEEAAPAEPEIKLDAPAEN